MQKRNGYTCSPLTQEECSCKSPLLAEQEGDLSSWNVHASMVALKLIQSSVFCGLLCCMWEQLRYAGCATSIQPGAALQQTAVLVCEQTRAKSVILWCSQDHCSWEELRKKEYKTNCNVVTFPFNTRAILGVPVYSSQRPFIEHSHEQLGMVMSSPFLALLLWLF